MPKWPVGLVQRLLPRKTEIVEQMPVIGEIAQGRALPVTFAPAQPFAQQPAMSSSAEIIAGAEGR